MKVLELQESTLFVPSLCCYRWTKKYFNESHPVLSAYNVQSSEPIHVHTMKVPSEIDKFKKMSKISKEICNMGSGMSTGEFQYFMEKVTNLRNEMSGTILPQPIANTTSSTNTSSAGTAPSISSVVATTSSTNTSSAGAAPSMSSVVATTLSTNTSSDSAAPPTSSVIATTSSTNASSAGTITSSRSDDVAAQSSTQTKNASTSGSSLIDEMLPVSQSTVNKNDGFTMKLPAKITSHGRPKGSGQTVIGTKKRKGETKTNTGPTPPKKKFLDLNSSEQSLTVLEWLTNKKQEVIKTKKVEYGDIIQDPIMFNRLRNGGIDLNGLKTYMDKQAYKYIIDEIERLNSNKYWACAKCNRNLNGFQIMCNKCLDWFHLTCTEYTSVPPKNIMYFCKSCNEQE